MKKLDLRKKYKDLYIPSAKKVAVVDVPDFLFVMIDGRMEKGKSPGESPSFQEAMQALYGAAYTLKFMSKLRKKNAIDYPVMALEGLWWVEGGTFDIRKPDNWRYRAMMMLPDHITPEMFSEALEKIRQKRPSPAVEKLRLERFHEGLSVQTMHIGPYAAEPATIERLNSFTAENGLALRGLHHEIYLGDPRRCAPEKLKTVIRHPVRKK
ncbi:MAG: GyrI-like domain-containing protein [Anaerolineales bacterium]